MQEGVAKKGNVADGKKNRESKTSPLQVAKREPECKKEAMAKEKKIRAQTKGKTPGR